MRKLPNAILLAAILLFPICGKPDRVLAASGVLEQEWPPQEFVVRVTFYTLRGIMASGVYTEKGSAACSKWMPFGTQLMFPDGYVVTCLDRGLGDRYWPGGWVDIWAPSYSWGLRYVEGDYGLWSSVQVIRWGWSED